jgi:hypothetical protein
MSMRGRTWEHIYEPFWAIDSSIDNRLSRFMCCWFEQFATRVYEGA